MATRHDLLQRVQNPNYASVLAALWRRRTLTRNQISDATGLAIPTVSRIVGELISAGLLKEDRETESKSGRPAGLVTIAPNQVYAAGIDLGGSKIAGALVDLSGAHKAEVSVPTGAHSREGLISSMVGLLDRLLESTGVTRDRVLGVGLGVPGTIDPRTRVLIDATNLHIADWDIEHDLASCIDLPVVAENDANAAALGEHFFGAAEHDGDLVFVSVGTGIGAGLLLNGEVYRGPLGQAGELGHVVIDLAGPSCSCGRHGCLEAYAGGWAVARAYAESRKDDETTITAEDVFRLADSGDETAREILSKASEVLGLALANLVNTLGVNQIVLGGGMICGHKTFLDSIRSSFLRHIIGEYEGLVSVRSTPLEHQAGVYGACALVLHEALHPSSTPLALGRFRDHGYVAKH